MAYVRSLPIEERMLTFYQPLRGQDEIIANTVWRFLQLRDFVDESHQLTKWGQVLCAALASVQGSSDLEEAAFLSVELLRYGLLNAAAVSPDDKGSPQTGTGKISPCVKNFQIMTCSNCANKSRTRNPALSCPEWLVQVACVTSPLDIVGL